METRRIGDYDIIKRIGQGALGSVYLAEHRFLKKQHVLKVLPRELTADRSFVKRFEEEAYFYSTLEHPHIVKLHNISFGEGYYFLVSDCVVDKVGETTNLAQYLKAKPGHLPEEKVVRILRQIATALDYAHSKKLGGRPLVHRGMKLNNIVIGKSPQGMACYLTDFGLTRIIGAGAVLTRIFQAVAESLAIAERLNVKDDEKQLLYPCPSIEKDKLTPLHHSFLQHNAFLAPEQKQLERENEVTEKVDVWAFGVLVYFLLTRRYPEGVFPLPSDCTKGYSSHWDAVVNSCLQMDPEKRPSLLLPLVEGEQIQKKEKVAEEIQEQPVTIINSTELKPVIKVAKLDRPEKDYDPAAAFHVDTTVKYYQPENKEEKNVAPILTDMIVIEGGTFYRGSNDGNRDEMPRHEVSLDSFAIDIHPITNEQFVRFLRAMGGEKDSNHLDIIRLKDSRIKRSGGTLSIESGYDKHPVVGVTWYGATAYTKWVGKRLPTEAEWEIAACGGNNNFLYPFGGEIEKSQANFFSSDTTTVMSYKPNCVGLYDVAGNVYEWCHDWYDYNSYNLSVQEPASPKGPLQGVYRVLRGGCWKSLKEDLRCSRRHRNNPGTVNSTYGFRCAADVK